MSELSVQVSCSCVFVSSNGGAGVTLVDDVGTQEDKGDVYTKET